MEIEYHQRGDVKAYSDFVNNPQNREYQKAFNRKFSNENSKAAIKLHNNLKTSPNALSYNLTYKKNPIEIMNGTRAKDPLLLKTYINRAYRKLFHYICSKEDRVFLTQEKWEGQFADVDYIYVCDANKHYRD